MSNAIGIEFDKLNQNKRNLLLIACNLHPELAWKLKNPNNQTFIVGIETPEGMYIQKSNLKHWNLFTIKQVSSTISFKEDSTLDKLISLTKKEGIL